MPDYPYQSPIQVDSSWPGLEAPTRELRVEPETLERLGRLLTGEAGSLSSDHSYLPAGVSYFDDTRQSSTVGLDQSTAMPAGAHWFGEWPTAGLMEYSLSCAQAGIVHYYRLLVDQVRAAGHLFQSTADDYRAVDSGVGADLAARAAGWDQLATDAGGYTGPPAGRFREFTEVPYINEYEDVAPYQTDWVIQQIDKLRGAQPWWHLHGAGDAFRATAERLTDLATLIRTQAGSLAGEWESETSVACQEALRRITATAEHLAEKSEQLSRFSHRSAEVMQEAVSSFPQEVPERGLLETVADLVSPGSPNQQANADAVRDALARLNDSYRQVNYTTLPGEIGADLPVLPTPLEDVRPLPPHNPPTAPSLPAPPVASPPPNTAGGGPVTPVGSGGPAGAESTGRLPGFVGVPAGESGLDDPNGPAGGLAGASGAVPSTAGPGAAGPGALGTGTGAPGVAGVSPAGAAGPLTPGGTGLVPGAPGGSGGRSGGVGGRVGGDGRGAGVGAVPVGGAGDRAGNRSAPSSPGSIGRPRAGGGSGSGVLPMGTGRAPEREKHSRPDSWLVEDDDPWRGDDDLPPPVIR